jgi:hypothetical protein
MWPEAPVLDRRAIERRHGRKQTRHVLPRAFVFAASSFNARGKAAARAAAI